MKPVSASLPVIAMSRSRPTASRIASHSAAVRWSFHRIAGRSDRVGGVEQDERRASGRSARSPSTSPPATPVAASTARIAATAPSHHSARVLLAPQRLRRVEAVLGRRRSPTTAPALVDEDGLGRGRRDVDPEDEAHGQRRRRAVAVGRPDALVDEVLERSWLPETGRGSISPAATCRLERLRASRRRRGSPRPSAPSQPA